MTEEKKNEFTKRIADAGRGEMVVVVYDIAISYLEEAIEAIGAGDKEAQSQALSGCRKSIGNLIDSLNMDYDISGNLLSLYTYFNKQLTLSRINSDVKEMQQIEDMMKNLRDSFAEVAKSDKGPAMVETERHVEVGMTYGKGVLNENVVNEGGHDFSV